jgi:hypothetical protein
MHYNFYTGTFGSSHTSADHFHSLAEKGLKTKQSGCLIDTQCTDKFTNYPVHHFWKGMKKKYLHVSRHAPTCLI